MEIHSVGPFILGKTLGSGTTGKVKLAFHKDTGTKVAIKIINKEFLSSRISMLKKVEREIAVMKLLNHPNVLKLYDVYETSKYLFLVLEHVEGGELFDYLVKKGKLDTQEAMAFFQQIIHGIEYCHNSHICHRDLKPENLLLDLDRNVKVADFGMASLMRKGSLLQTSCGSPHYASPEVVMGYKYDGKAADVWSCGVILFALLTGKLPFDDDNIRRLLSKVKSGIFSMPQFLHKDIKDLIWKMLTVDPAKRITIAEIKEHPWFKTYAQPSASLFVGVDQMEGDPIDIDSIDEEILRSLQALGLGEEEEIKQNLTSTATNQTQVYYRILLERKENPPAEYLPSPKIRIPLTRPRTNSAPALYIPPVVGSSPPATPPAPTSPLANRPNSPSTVAPHPFAKESGVFTPLTPMNGSPPPSPVMSSPPSSPTSIPRNLLAKRRSSSAASSGPINIVGTSSRFQKMKLESVPSGSPIIGSSPKRSWFTSFFSKAEKEEAPKKESLGIQSKKPIFELVAELERCMGLLQIEWEEIHTNQIYHGKYRIPGAPSVNFSVEILNLGKDGTFFINFVHQTGSVDDYNILCERIQKELQI